MGALADKTLRPELRGNEEARRLMQETLQDEAEFAAANAAAAAMAASGLEESSGSPPLKISYV